MSLDVTTLLVFSSLITVVISTLFLAETWSRDAPLVDRLWSLGFASALLTALCYVADEAVTGLWFALALGNGFLVLTPMALWNGIRVYGGRRSLVEVSIAASLVAVVATLVSWPEGGSWSGASVYLLGNAVGSLLSAVAMARARRYDVRAARYLTVIMAMGGSYFLVRWVLFLIGGADSDLFQTYAGTGIAAILVPLWMIGAAFSMIALRQTQEHSRREEQGNFDPMTGARTCQSFIPRAEAVLRARAADGSPVCVVTVRPEHYDDIAVAFGREAADRAFVAAGEVTISMLPGRAVVGRDPNGLAFQALLPGVPPEEAARWAEDVRAELVAEPFETQGTRMRLSARFGIASSQTHGYDLDSLCEASREACGLGDEPVTLAPGTAEQPS